MLLLSERSTSEVDVCTVSRGMRPSRGAESDKDEILEKKKFGAGWRGGVPRPPAGIISKGPIWYGDGLPRIRAYLCKNGDDGQRLDQRDIFLLNAWERVSCNSWSWRALAGVCVSRLGESLTVCVALLALS